MNHLDFNGVQWLIKEIKKYKGTVLLISHERYFLNQCINRILEIEEGNINQYHGNYSFYRDEKKKRHQSQLNQYLIQEETKKKINEQIDTLKNWSEKAHRESRKKALAEGNRFGGKEYNRAKAKKMDIQIKSRIKRLEKINVDGVQKPKEEKRINFSVQKGKLKATRIIEAINISKSFTDKLLFKGSSFYIEKREKIGIFGDNGCGKTTLLKILLGEENADSGKVFLSSSIKAGYLSQSVMGIDIEKSVIDIFDIISRAQRGNLQTLLFNMGFDERMLLRLQKTIYRKRCL